MRLSRERSAFISAEIHLKTDNNRHGANFHAFTFTFTSLMPFFGCLSHGSFMVSEWKIAVVSCVLGKSDCSACNGLRCGYKSGPGRWAKQ